MSAKPESPLAAAFPPAQLRRILEEPEFFHLIFDAFPLQVVIKSARPESFGQFLLWNRVAEEWMGLSAAEVLGRTDRNFFTPEQSAFFEAKDRDVIAGRVPLDIPEEPIESRTRGRRYLHTIKTPIFDDAGAPLALLVVSEDVTERRATADELESTLAQLRDERNLFLALLDRLPVCAFARKIRDAQPAEYILWNRAAERFHGLKAGEVLGRRAEELFHPETVRAFEDQDRVVITTGDVLDVPLQSVRHGVGGSRLMHTVKAPVVGLAGELVAVVGVAEDITERVRGEAERAEAMEMLTTLNSRVPGAIYRLRVTPDGRRSFTYLSERIEDIFGVKAAALMADYGTLCQRILPEDLADVRAAEAAAAETGGDFHAEFRVRQPDGTIRWAHSTASRAPADDGGSIWSGFVMDVTQRREAERALRESEQRWELALAGTEAGVWDWNIVTGELFYSERWRRMFGCGPEALPRTPGELLGLVHDEDRHAVRQRTLDLLRRRTELFRCEYRMRRVGGDWLWILAHAKAHFDASGRPRRMIGTLIDISDRKRVEAQLLEAKLAAENASRAKGDFLAMMSHEIRTPLNGVLGFADLLAATPLDAQQAEYLQTIRESGANLLRVLNDVLDYSKIESGKLAVDPLPTDLRELVQAAVETFRAKAADKRLSLRAEVAPAAPEVVIVDALRLRQILTNLISNAVKFTESGEVSVHVGFDAEASSDDEAVLRFEVRDTGIGMTADDLPRLFEPFEQLDLSMARRFQGTGLGLSIVRRLVGMLGGGIVARSEPGVGTAFVVDLTLPRGRAGTAPRRAVAGDVLPVRPLTLLLVEDHAVNRRLARLLLERLGYAPDEAQDGASAVARAAERRYDVILMDIQMPGMDGYEAARRIRETCPEAQIVALTAHAMPADRDRSREAGMRAHLTKPVRTDDLRAVLAECASRLDGDHS